MPHRPPRHSSPRWWGAIFLLLGLASIAWEFPAIREREIQLFLANLRAREMAAGQNHLQGLAFDLTLLEQLNQTIIGELNPLFQKKGLTEIFEKFPTLPLHYQFFTAEREGEPTDQPLLEPPSLVQQISPDSPPLYGELTDNLLRHTVYCLPPPTLEARGGYLVVEADIGAIFRQRFDLNPDSRVRHLLLRAQNQSEELKIILSNSRILEGRFSPALDNTGFPQNGVSMSGRFFGTTLPLEGIFPGRNLFLQRLYDIGGLIEPLGSEVLFTHFEPRLLALFLFALLLIGWEIGESRTLLHPPHSTPLQGITLKKGANLLTRKFRRRFPAISLVTHYSRNSQAIAPSLPLPEFLQQIWLGIEEVVEPLRPDRVEMAIGVALDFHKGETRSIFRLTLSLKGLNRQDFKDPLSPKVALERPKFLSKGGYFRRDGTRIQFLEIALTPRSRVKKNMENNYRL